MGENAKGWMIGQNMNIWDMGASDIQHLGHNRDIITNMVMKGEFPNQGLHGLLCAKEKDTINYDGKIYST
jgi:hypothetical protein